MMGQSCRSNKKPAKRPPTTNKKLQESIKYCMDRTAVECLLNQSLLECYSDHRIDLSLTENDNSLACDYTYLCVAVEVHP